MEKNIIAQIPKSWNIIVFKQKKYFEIIDWLENTEKIFKFSKWDLG